MSQKIGDIVTLSWATQIHKSIKYIVVDVSFPPQAEIVCVDLVKLKKHSFFWYEVDLLVSG